MPRNITMVRTWPYGVILHADAVRRKPNLPVTSWMVKYARSESDREVDEKMALFTSGKT